MIHLTLLLLTFQVSSTNRSLSSFLANNSLSAGHTLPLLFSLIFLSFPINLLFFAFFAKYFFGEYLENNWTGC